ncbi:MAG: hypothetical protein EB060_11240 [Proteobacteria bacterium]|nr:hypothetical protein [Pseudomonadota bacterium]
MSVKKELGLSFVQVTLPEDKAYIFRTSIPKVSEAQVRQAIEFQLEENVPLSPAEAVFDFIVLPQNAAATPDEMNRIVTYWQTHKDKNGAVGKPIQKIYLCGSGAHLCGFDEYISTTMKIETEVGNVWQNAFTFEDSIPQITRPDSLSYASAIGSALASFQSHV